MSVSSDETITPSSARPGPHRTFSGPPHSIKGQLFAITGAASGIGCATATLLVKNGAKVSLADKDKDAVEELARTLGSNAWGYGVDVTKRDEVEYWISHAASRWNMQGLDGESMRHSEGHPAYEDEEYMC
jgi:hypothetical protein